MGNMICVSADIRQLLLLCTLLVCADRTDDQASAKHDYIFLALLP